MRSSDRHRPWTPRMILVVAAICAAGAIGQAPAEPEQGPVDRRIGGIVRQVDAGRAEPATYAPAFLEAIPAAQLNAVFAAMRSAGGRVVEVKPTGRESPWAAGFRFRYAKGFEGDVSLTVDATPPHRVIGLWFSPLRPTIASLDEVAERVAALPGKTHFLAAELLDGWPPRTIAAHRPDLPLAIGSTFKLYVLAALQADDTPWERVVYLRDDHRSLPSGVLQDWPADTPMTAFALAGAMISISDNTATDALIDHVGRDRLAALLPEFGNQHAELNTPFLSTLELFKLRSDAALAERYAEADATDRAAMLDREIADVPRAAVVPPVDRPGDIERIEWFASADDLARLLDWLTTNADRTALDTLAINPGLSFVDRFARVGYKGGSEPGVLNLTWLLETEAGRRYALTATWNDPTQPLDDDRLVQLMHAAANLVADNP